MSDLFHRFRWVACQLDYLSALPSHNARRKALQELPPTLHETYQRILERVLQNGAYPGVEALVMRTLQWIGVAYPPMTITELCEAVSLNDDMVSIDSEDIVHPSEILRCCSSLIRKSHDGLRFEFAHFTVL